MAIAAAQTDLTYPATFQFVKDGPFEAVDTDEKRMLVAYAGWEAIHLLHNEYIGDLSAKAIAHREKCREAMTMCLDDVLQLRTTVKTEGWEPATDEQCDPKHLDLKATGKAAHASADVKTLTGVTIEDKA